MELRQTVLKTILDHHLVEKGNGVVIGVSGGPDSVCLLHILHSLADNLDIRLYAVHINHMLRAEEAQADEDYATELCRRLNVPFSAVRTDVADLADKSGMTLEEAGREARYREFEAFARRVGAARIAVAHNRNDQAETVMMHIVRGSGMAGLVGMEFRRGSVIRPLLNVGRPEIEQYCREFGLLPRTDSTNLKSEFTRNRVRLELFPFIDANFGSDITESLYRLSALAAEDNSFLNQLADESYYKCLVADPSCSGHSVRLSIKALKQLHPAILGRVLKRAVCEVSGSSTGISNVHYESLKAVVSNGRTGTRLELPRGLRAVVSYGILEFCMSSGAPDHKPKAKEFEAGLSIPGRTYVPELDSVVTASLEKSENIDNLGKIRYNSLVQFFDYDILLKGIHIRNRRNGDIFKPYHSNGTKKLKEYFIDNKIPRESRDRIPLVCMGNEIVWVIGHKISDKFKVTENTKSVLKMEYNRRASL